MDIEIVPGSINSCVERNEAGEIVFPYKFRNQKEIHPGSCLHHSLCPVIECLHRDKMRGQGPGQVEDEKLCVDVGYLIREHPVSIGGKQLLNRLKNVKEPVAGGIRCENQSFPFQLSSYKEYKRNRDEFVKFRENFAVNKQPGMGFFGFHSDCKPEVGRVFVRNRELDAYSNCPGCARPIKKRHVICVSGTAQGRSQTVADIPLVEYIDSSRPGQLHYMDQDSLDLIIVPSLLP